MQPDDGNEYHEGPLERANIRSALSPTAKDGSGMSSRAKATMGLGVVSLLGGVLCIAIGQPIIGLIAGFLGLLAAGATMSIEGDRERAVSENHRLMSQVGELETALTNERSRSEATISKPSASDDQSPSTSATGSSLIEPATGLFTEEYFIVTLDARVAAARRNLRPVSVVLLQVVTGVSGGAARPSEAAAVAQGIRATLREADTPCIMNDGMFGLLLEDTPENGAVWTVERLRRRLSNDRAGQTLWAGVACYPAHAFTASEILDQATVALDSAREWRQDRIEVAVGEP